MNITANVPSRTPLLARNKPSTAQRQSKEVETQAKPAPNPLAEFFESIGEFFFGKRTSDLPNDGERVEVPSEHPLAEDRRDMIFVGGAGTDFEKAQDDSAELANRLGRDVTLIHNATAIPKIEGGLFSAFTSAQEVLEGAHEDMAQVVSDFHGEGYNEAVEAVKSEIRTRFNQGEEKVDLMGSSQGNQIIARALRELSDEPDMAARMKDVNVVNMMGPTRRQDYPEEVNYSHVELPSDPVTQLLGENVPQDQLADRNNNYDDRAWQLPGLLASGGWPGHNPLAILGPAVGTAPISEHELASIGMSREQLQALQRQHLDRIDATFV